MKSIAIAATILFLSLFGASNASAQNLHDAAIRIGGDIVQLEYLGDYFADVTGRKDCVLFEDGSLFCN